MRISWKKSRDDFNTPLPNMPGDRRETLAQGPLGSWLCAPQPGHRGWCLPPRGAPGAHLTGQLMWWQQGASPVPQPRAPASASVGKRPACRPSHSSLGTSRDEGRVQLARGKRSTCFTDNPFQEEPTNAALRAARVRKNRPSPQLFLLPPPTAGPRNSDLQGRGEVSLKAGSAASHLQRVRGQVEAGEWESDLWKELGRTNIDWLPEL